MSEHPFNTDLESPISRILRLRSDSPDSVVVTDRPGTANAGSGATDLQKRMRVESTAARSVLDAIRAEDNPGCIVLSGSAGTGKSAAIDEVLGSAAGELDTWIADATHADSPSRDQLDRLAEFFQPFADGKSKAPGARTRLIALNTGMALAFFGKLEDRHGADHPFRNLEQVLRYRLGLPGGTEAAADLELAGTVMVVNFDNRPTTGASLTSEVAADSLFTRMLAAVAPDDKDGVLAGSPRCGTCEVRRWCWVRTNAALASAGPSREALDQAVHQISLQRGRPLPPRALWDLISDLLTGGGEFDGTDPCRTVAGVAEDGDREAVFERLLPNTAFTRRVTPEGFQENARGRLSKELSKLDPSFRSDSAVHDTHSQVGIDSARDAVWLRDALRAAASNDPAAEAIGTGVEAVARRELGEEETARVNLARTILRARFLAGELPTVADDTVTFVKALEEYASWSRWKMHGGDEDPPTSPSLTRVLNTVNEGLTRGFGQRAGGEVFFDLDSSSSSSAGSGFRISIEAPRDRGGPLGPRIDAVIRTNPMGARSVGYEPHSIAMALEAVVVTSPDHRAPSLQITLPLYLALMRASRGMILSSADREHHFAVSQTVEAIAEQAVMSGAQRSLLIEDRRTGSRYRLGHERDLLGGEVVSLREVHS